MEYLTIAEFAEKAGVTPQAVYRRLKADLEPFVKVENKTKLINQAALELFKVKQAPQVSKEAQRIQELETLLTLIQEEKSALISQVADLSKQIAEMSVKHAQQIENFQLLLAQNQQLQQTLIQSVSSVESVNKHLEAIETTVAKPSFFKRLFASRKVDKV